jgi:hypothetical protein
MNKLDKLLLAPSEIPSAAIALVEEIESESVEPDRAAALTESREIAREATISALAGRVLYWRHKAEALQAFFKPYLEAYEAELKALESNAERAELAIQTLVKPGQTFKNETCEVKYRTTERGEVYDQDAIPFEFCKIPEPKPSLELLKQAAKLGQEVPGYRLQVVHHLQIKHGKGAKTKEIEE